MLYAPLAFLLLAQPVLAKPAAPARRPTPAAAIAQTDEQALKNVFVDCSGPGLLEFFRKRVSMSADGEHVNQLTKQLSDHSEGVHNKAMGELVALGSLAVPALRRVINHAENADTVARAHKCLQVIEGAGGVDLLQCAVRLLAAHQPEGTVEALMTYLPYADEETVVQEIETALLGIGLHDGTPDTALMRALADATPIRRSVAAKVLCQIGGRAGREAVRPLLKDAKPSVRMQAALSLTDLHETDAMTVLIDVIAVLPPEGCKRVEEYLAELAGEWGVKTPQGSDHLSGRLRRELWSAWWRALDGKQLLDEFRNRTLSEEEHRRASEWIGKLNDASPDVRAKVAENLVGMGPRVASLLRQTIEKREGAPSDPKNIQLIRSAKQCLATIEGDSIKPMPESAPRLLALRRPEGAVETILAYLPFAESDLLAEQLVDMLATVGCVNNKAAPALVRALEDKESVRRAAAVVALCKGKTDDAELPAIRKLLKDPDITVRLRTAVSLTKHGDKSAVPALIALLADLPLDQVWEAEDILTTLGEDKSPNKRIGADKASRTAAVKAWKDWWQKEEKNVDLAKLNDAQRDNGLLLAIDMNQGKILEVNRSGRVRWQIQGVQWPSDAVVCRNRNIFVVQQNNNQVSMRSRQGKEIWQQSCNMPFACQQLRNGNIFVVCRQQTSEYDINGKEVSSQQFGHLGWIVGGYKFPNGHIGLITQQGQYVRVDASGKQVKTFQVNFPGGFAMNAEVLPGDRILASLNIGRVAEYDDKGKSLWEANIVNPAFPHRLPNGHTLVAQNGMNHLYELDRNGKIVSEKKDLEFRPFRIRRR